MRCDHVDLFYIHRREHDRPLPEVIGTLSRLIEEGKIGGYGLSEIAPYTLREAHAIHPCRAVQNEYSLWTRQPELGLIQACKALGVAFVPFSPLARGMFGDTAIARPEDGFRSANPRFTEPNFSANTAKINAFRSFATNRGWSTPAAALAWGFAAHDFGLHQLHRACRRAASERVCDSAQTQARGVHRHHGVFVFLCEHGQVGALRVAGLAGHAQLCNLLGALALGPLGGVDGRAHRAAH